MKQPGLVGLQWPGLDALRQAREAIARGDEVKIEFPEGEHYALYRHLHPGAAPGEAATTVVSGGAELVGRLAGFTGLEELGELEALVRRHHYRARFASPQPELRLIPPNR